VGEDLHWADEASLELLHMVVRDAIRLPLLVALTTRAGQSSPHLIRLLANLERSRLAAELHLEPLSDEAVAAMIAETFQLDRSPRADFVAAIAELTDGNPLFVEEALRALTMTGDILKSDRGWDRRPVAQLRVPRSVEDAVMRQARGLDRPAHDLLRAAAVMGRRFDLDLLRAVTGTEEVALRGPLKRLIEAQLIAEKGVGTYGFRHELTRRAVYDSMSGLDRAPIHLRVLQALQSGGAEAGHLASHAAGAGAWSEAFELGLRAGNEARTNHSPTAALVHYDVAQQAAERLGRTVSGDFHLGRALAAEAAGDFETALQSFGAALAAARATGDSRLEVESLLGRGLLWSSRDFVQAGADYRAALVLTQETGDEVATARAQNRLANWHMNQDDAVTALDLHATALATFELLGDERGVAETFDFLGMAAYMAADLDRSWDAYERAEPMLRRLDDRQRLAIGLMMRTVCAGSYHSETVPVRRASPEEARRLAEQALAIAAADDWPSGECLAHIELTLHLGFRGDYAEALRHGRAALDLAGDIGHQQWLAGAHLALGAVLVDVLDAASARRHLSAGLARAQAIGSRNWILQNSAMLARACLLDGDVKGAESALAAAGLDADSTPSLPARMAWFAAAATAISRRNLDGADAILDRLAATLPAGGRPPALTGLRAEVLLRRGRASEAQELVSEAVEQAEEDGAASLEWRLRGLLARALIKERRRAEAEAQLERAEAIVAKLAAGMEERAAAEQFASRAHAALPRTRPTTPLRAARRAAGGLTAREREVARLVAAGDTNQEIAQALFLSRRTVEDHVSRILGRLDLASRAQLAAWVAQNLQKVP
jgi:DNA-binding NarL/FixJ family response regulator